MRSSTTTPVNSLLFLLVWGGLWLQSAQVFAASGRPGDRSKTAPPTREFPRIFGGGINRADAEKDALKKAGKVLDEFLQELDPPVAWRPSPAYIKKHLFKGDPERAPEKDQRVDDDTTVLCWTWNLVIGPQDWYDIHYRDRKARLEDRMSLLGRILAGLVALFAVVAGYIRADDWTKGYYTGWLRVGAGTALALVATALWWLS